MYQKMNSMYMRVLRRIAGMCKYSGNCEGSDSKVRAALGAPSLMCLIMRKRLLLVSSVVSHGSDALRAMLSCKSRGVDAMCLPWIRHVRADMHALQVFHAPRLDELGDPGLHSEAWCS